MTFPHSFRCSTTSWASPSPPLLSGKRLPQTSAQRCFERVNEPTGIIRSLRKYPGSSRSSPRHSFAMTTSTTKPLVLTQVSHDDFRHSLYGPTIKPRILGLSLDLHDPESESENSHIYWRRSASMGARVGESPRSQLPSPSITWKAVVGKLE